MLVVMVVALLPPMLNMGVSGHIWTMVMHTVLVLSVPVERLIELG